ncbi:MAG: hypothetical protein PVG99_15850, partial [Desulfobacteraceae bacterium]
MGRRGTPVKRQVERGSGAEGIRIHTEKSPPGRRPASAESRDGGQAPGLLHYIMIWGTERRKIFVS